MSRDVGTKAGRQDFINISYFGENILVAGGVCDSVLDTEL